MCLKLCYMITCLNLRSAVGIATSFLRPMARRNLHHPQALRVQAFSYSVRRGGCPGALPFLRA